VFCQTETPPGPPASPKFLDIETCGCDITGTWEHTDTTASYYGSDTTFTYRRYVFGPSQFVHEDTTIATGLTGLCSHLYLRADYSLQQDYFVVHDDSCGGGLLPAQGLSGLLLHIHDGRRIHHVRQSECQLRRVHAAIGHT
jgi:hypothetical protein